MEVNAAQVVTALVAAVALMVALRREWIERNRSRRADVRATIEAAHVVRMGNAEMTHQLVLTNVGEGDATDVTCELRGWRGGDPNIMVVWHQPEPFPLPLLGAGEPFGVTGVYVTMAEGRTEAIVRWRDRRRGQQERVTLLSVLY